MGFWYRVQGFGFPDWGSLSVFHAGCFARWPKSRTHGLVTSLPEAGGGSNNLIWKQSRLQPSTRIHGFHVFPQSAPFSIEVAAELSIVKSGSIPPSAPGRAAYSLFCYGCCSCTDFHSCYALWLQADACLSIYLSVYLSIYLSVCMYVCIYKNMWIYIYIYIYIYTCRHTYIYIYIYIMYCTSFCIVFVY